MNRQEFLVQLRKGLSGLSQDDIEGCLTFYSEAIEDRMEEGLSEEEAISAVGFVDEIVTQVVTETSLAKITKEKMKSKRQLSAGEIMLLILGCPIWLSLGIATVAVIFSLYISLWAIFGSVIGCALGGIAAGFVFTLNGNGLSGIAMIGAGIVCSGLCIFMFYGCKTITKGILTLTKKTTVWIKNCFIKKEEA